MRKRFDEVELREVDGCQDCFFRGKWPSPSSLTQVLPFFDKIAGNRASWQLMIDKGHVSQSMRGGHCVPRVSKFVHNQRWLLRSYKSSRGYLEKSSRAQWIPTHNDQHSPPLSTIFFPNLLSLSCLSSARPCALHLPPLLQVHLSLLSFADATSKMIRIHG